MTDLAKLVEECQERLDIAKRCCQRLIPWSSTAQASLDSIMDAKAKLSEVLALIDEQQPETERRMEG
jgi:hypothetical protein